MTVLAIFNQKGGVGKTTTSLNLAAGLAKRGQDPLTIDLDPQAHLSLVTGVTVSASKDSIFGFYKEGRHLAELVRPMACGGHIIPSHFELSKVDTLFGKGPKIVNRLGEGIRDEMLDQAGGAILIDCCPMLGVLSLNAIFAATRVLVPVSADFLSVKGTAQLDQTLKALEHVLKRRVTRRYFITRYDGRRKLAREIAQTLREKYGDELCETRISENVSLAESPGYNRDIFAHAPNSQGAKDYNALLDELRASRFL